MVKPPDDFWRCRVLEIDDGVLIAGEVSFVEQRSGAVQKAGELKLDIAADAFAVEAGKQSSRTRAIKTAIVKKDFKFQTNPFQCNLGPGTSSQSGTSKANRNAIWEGGLSSGERTWV